MGGSSSRRSDHSEPDEEVHQSVSFNCYVVAQSDTAVDDENLKHKLAIGGNGNSVIKQATVVGCFQRSHESGRNSRALFSVKEVRVQILLKAGPTVS